MQNVQTPNHLIFYWYLINIHKMKRGLFRNSRHCTIINSKNNSLMKRESWISRRRFKSFFKTYIRANFSNFSKHLHRTEIWNVGKSGGAFKKAFRLYAFSTDWWTLSFIIILSLCKIFPAWWLVTGSNRKYKWIQLQYGHGPTFTARFSPRCVPHGEFVKLAQLLSSLFRFFRLLSRYFTVFVKRITYI